MKIFLETTEWKDSTPNHQYILSDDKRTCSGYQKRDKGTEDVFKTNFI